jgi:hypothetical protein
MVKKCEPTFVYSRAQRRGGVLPTKHTNGREKVWLQRLQKLAQNKAEGESVWRCGGEDGSVGLLPAWHSCFPLHRAGCPMEAGGTPAIPYPIACLALPADAFRETSCNSWTTPKGRGLRPAPLVFVRLSEVSRKASAGRAKQAIGYGIAGVPPASIGHPARCNGKQECQAGKRPTLPSSPPHRQTDSPSALFCANFCNLCSQTFSRPFVCFVGKTPPRLCALL